MRCLYHTMWWWFRGWRREGGWYGSKSTLLFFMSISFSLPIRKGFAFLASGNISSLKTTMSKIVYLLSTPPEKKQKEKVLHMFRCDRISSSDMVPKFMIYVRETKWASIVNYYEKRRYTKISRIITRAECHPFWIMTSGDFNVIMHRQAGMGSSPSKEPLLQKRRYSPDERKELRRNVYYNPDDEFVSGIEHSADKVGSWK